MLDKEICKRCYKSHKMTWDDERKCVFMSSQMGCSDMMTPNQLWESERVIHCPFRDLNATEFSSGMTFSEALKNCPYFLEHIMEIQENVK